jgi:hypothetical protein
MDILDVARHCGMQVTLDARIGRETYQSVYGSVEALTRFAQALLGATEGSTSQARTARPRSRDDC